MMICQCKPRLFRLVLMLIFVLVLIYVLSNIGCAYEDNVSVSTEKRPQVVKEDPRPIHNDMGLSIGDFFIYAGNEIKNMESWGLRVYKIKPDMGRDIAGKYKIYTIWVYYD